MAAALIPTGYMPKASLKQIDIAQKNLTEERIPVWKQLLGDMKDAVLSNLALSQIQRRHAGRKNEGRPNAPRAAQAAAF